MAEPHQVHHGNFHGKLVRVHAERYVPAAEFDATNEQLVQKKLPARTREEAVASTVAFAIERGFPSGTIAKVVMVSRFGDCGVTKYLRSAHGYSLRLYPECLEIIPEEEWPAILRDYDEGKLHPKFRPAKP